MKRRHNPAPSFQPFKKPENSFVKFRRPPRGPKGQEVRTAATQPQIDEVPAWWQGNWPEYLVYWALVKLRFKPQEDFLWQEPVLGGRIDMGGSVVDFRTTESAPSGFPIIALPVQGEHWHPLFGPKFEKDKAAFLEIQERLGWEVIPLDVLDLMRDALTTVKLAVIDRKNISRYKHIL